MIESLASAMQQSGEETLRTVLAVLGWVTSFAVAIIGALTVRNAKAAAKTEGRAEGKAEAMQIGPQPFMVELKEAFVTRREFDRLEGMVAVNASRVEGMFRETMKEVKDLHAATAKTIQRQGEKLSQDIKDVASGAYLGRQKIHHTVNANAERLAKVEERLELTTELSAVAETIVEAINANK